LVFVVVAVVANDDCVHNSLLEIIDWTRNKTAGKHHACTAIRKQGEISPDYLNETESRN
jgi:hypothetical protein